MNPQSGFRGSSGTSGTAGISGTGGKACSSGTSGPGYKPTVDKHSAFFDLMNIASKALANSISNGRHWKNLNFVEEDFPVADDVLNLQRAKEAIAEIEEKYASELLALRGQANTQKYGI